jgi:hypothetical protein
VRITKIVVENDDVFIGEYGGTREGFVYSYNEYTNITEKTPEGDCEIIDFDPETMEIEMRLVRGKGA